MKGTKIILSLVAVALSAALVAPAAAQTKFPFRLNWTLYGEHAPFFVARDKGFYKEEGLDVEIQEGSGSTTVSTPGKDWPTRNNSCSRNTDGSARSGTPCCVEVAITRPYSTSPVRRWNRFTCVGET